MHGGHLCRIVAGALRSRCSVRRSWVVMTRTPLPTSALPHENERRLAPISSGGDAPRRMPESGGRLLLVLLFWFGAATSVELWWLGVDGLHTEAGVFTAAGRLTGLASGYLLLTQILLMSRVGWLERSVGAHGLARWHRRLGGWLVFLVLAHLAFIVVGYAALGGTGIAAQAWAMFIGYEDLDEAFIAAALLTVLGLLAIRGIRRSLPYEACTGCT